MSYVLVLKPLIFINFYIKILKIQIVISCPSQSQRANQKCNVKNMYLFDDIARKIAAGTQRTSAPKEKENGVPRGAHRVARKMTKVALRARP